MKSGNGQTAGNGDFSAGPQPATSASASVEQVIKRYKDELSHRKGVAMYILLFVAGLLLIVAAQVVRPRYPAESRQADLATLIADAQSIRVESQSLLDGLKTVPEGDLSFLQQLLDYEIRFKSVDTRIKQLVSHLPGESEAQARAARLATSMRPKVADAFALVRATVAKAALQGLVRVESVSDPLLPEPVMVSAYELRSRSRTLKDSGLKISFNQDWYWNVYVELGQVKSPQDLAPWTERTDLKYPMLQLTENGITLATVGFDSKTTELTINAHDASSRFAQSLDALKREYQQDELVAHAILDLLQDAQARRSTG